MSVFPAILAHPEVADIDRHFATFIAGFGEGELPALAALLLSRNIRQGHVCLDLADGPVDFDEAPLEFAWPELEAWRRALSKNRAIGSPDQQLPLVLDQRGRLYLRRYWEYESTLAGEILKRAGGNAPTAAAATDLQQLAVETALARRFVVVSGGPGTGKTTTVLKILEGLLSEPGGERLRIALAAPTGKAAARLQETLRVGNSADGMSDRLPQSATTLHRLLGARGDSIYFRHNAKHPLPVDVVVVDEASMVPLTMMAKLFEALPESARVILLGDHDQLASVEPGAVLGDIAEAASRSGGPLHGCLVVLRKNYRFGNESNVFALCDAVRQGRVDAAIEMLKAGSRPDLAAQPVPAARDLGRELRAQVIAGYSPYLRATDPADAIKELQRFRILCALRAGPFGVANLNRRVEEVLRAEGLIFGPPTAYRGMPILITRNDYQLRLFNGDIGVLLPDGPDGPLHAWFVGEGGNLRRVPPARLPAHELAFAMTVHKSQGSEFDNVLLLLPDQPTRVLTRELVYTGLTRARTRVEIWYQEAVLRDAIERRVQRRSGLQEKLRPAEA